MATTIKLEVKRNAGWQSSDKMTWIPSVSETYDKLDPGFYEPVYIQNIGFVPKKLELGERDLFRLPDPNSQLVLEDIQNFWKKQEYFEKYKFPYKRGILLYGPPGTGKSCTISLLVQDVTQMGGIVLRFEDYNSWISVYKSIRQIQPDVPMIALLEDLDQIIDENSVSTILNLLDGLEQSLNKIVFLATTNNPQRIADNIKNRPSRFDRRVKIGLPNENIRQAYLEHLFSTGGSKIPSSDWITKTKGFSLAHLKELFISVICLGNDFNTVLDELRKMKEIITAED